MNLYITNQNTFHQKTLELLSVDRPAASFPGETDEAIGIADQYGCTLYSCATADDLARALDSALSIPEAAAKSGLEDAYSWDALAEKLEDVFNAILEDGTN